MKATAACVRSKVFFMAMLGYGPFHAQIIDMNLSQRCLRSVPNRSAFATDNAEGS